MRNVLAGIARSAFHHKEAAPPRAPRPKEARQSLRLQPTTAAPLIAPQHAAYAKFDPLFTLAPPGMVNGQRLRSQTTNWSSPQLTRLVKPTLEPRKRKVMIQRPPPDMLPLLDVRRRDSNRVYRRHATTHFPMMAPYSRPPGRIVSDRGRVTTAEEEDVGPKEPKAAPQAVPLLKTGGLQQRSVRQPSASVGPSPPPPASPGSSLTSPPMSPSMTREAKPEPPKSSEVILNKILEVLTVLITETVEIRKEMKRKMRQMVEDGVQTEAIVIEEPPALDESVTFTIEQIAEMPDETGSLLSMSNGSASRQDISMEHLSTFSQPNKDEECVPLIPSLDESCVGLIDPPTCVGLPERKSEPSGLPTLDI
eukprot:Blabericola_migrator_1__1092@NODE_127_length_13302_cov_126_428410_g112_i0_p4_GENE_NODE_127_length_13302_cov_126_428410_g112_i0NODE_127_length_13302_cov_126_428410_g112_i0_p4_ORF_typecomplete_len365_score63_73PRIMA1/PF16101_5/3_1e03PRIMA1/PF16101_5/0_0076_NODE_127_length_13302_cov_126_428410_g112_i053126406